MSDARDLTSWVAPPPTRIMTGDEPIEGVDATVRDFWAWTLSDLRTNTVRPMLAEFLVAKALGAAHRPRVEWDAYDVLTPEGIKVGVKSGAYVQAWAQSGPSVITFGGLSARTWMPDAEHSPTRSFNADVYVFAVLTAAEPAAYDALDIGQWSFWLLPRSVVEATGQRSLRLSRVKALAGDPVAYDALADQVRALAADVARTHTEDGN
jgi:hypothetical protein